MFSCALLFLEELTYIDRGLTWHRGPFWKKMTGIQRLPGFLH